MERKKSPDIVSRRTHRRATAKPAIRSNTPPFSPGRQGGPKGLSPVDTVAVGIAQALDPPHPQQMKDQCKKNGPQDQSAQQQQKINRHKFHKRKKYVSFRVARLRAAPASSRPDRRRPHATGSATIRDSPTISGRKKANMPPSIACGRTGIAEERIRAQAPDDGLRACARERVTVA